MTLKQLKTISGTDTDMVLDIILQSMPDKCIALILQGWSEEQEQRINSLNTINHIRRLIK